MDQPRFVVSLYGDCIGPGCAGTRRDHEVGGHPRDQKLVLSGKDLAYRDERCSCGVFWAWAGFFPRRIRARVKLRIHSLGWFISHSGMN